MSPSVNPKPPFTSCSLASRDTRASSAGSNLTTASLSAWDCALAPQAPRVATNRITAEIDEFFMTPRSHPQNSSDLRNVLARLQAVRDDRFEPILDGVAQTVQAFPHPMRSAYGRIEDVLEGLHLVPQQLNVAGPALDSREIAFQGVDKLRHFIQIDFRGRFLSCVVPGHFAAYLRCPIDPCGTYFRLIRPIPPACHFTSSTGMGEMFTTRFAQEPSSRLAAALIPRVPMTMRTQRVSRACLTMVSATGPTRMCAEYLISAASRSFLAFDRAAFPSRS